MTLKTKYILFAFTAWLVLFVFLLYEAHEELIKLQDTLRMFVLGGIISNNQ
jgi:hypothetical protein